MGVVPELIVSFWVWFLSTVSIASEFRMDAILYNKTIERPCVSSVYNELYCFLNDERYHTIYRRRHNKSYAFFQV